jgi:hypothetical protein
MNDPFLTTAYNVSLNFWNEEKATPEISKFYKSVITYSFYKQKITTDWGFGNIVIPSEEKKLSRRSFSLKKHPYYDFNWSSISLELIVSEESVLKLMDFEIIFYFDNSADCLNALKSFIDLFILNNGYVSKHTSETVEITNSQEDTVLGVVKLDLKVSDKNEHTIIFKFKVD